jgi:hypothetical protein
MSLHFANAQHGIVAAGAGGRSGNIAIRRVRVRWLLYSGHLKPEAVDRRFRESLPRAGGDLVRLSGDNVQVTDSDFYSSGRSILLPNVRGALIARNTFYNGRMGWYSIAGGERIIFERNAVIGADLMSSGGGVNSLGGMPSSQLVYFAENTFRNLHGWDREAMTTDGGGGEHIGPVAAATAATVTFDLSQGWKADVLKGRAAYVIAG